jgi:chromosome segregation ATPase
MQQTVSHLLRRALFAIVALGLMLLAVPAAHAQNPNAQRNTASAEARKRIAEAKSIVDDIKKDETRIKEKRRGDFETKEEWKDTVANHKKAKAEYEKARTDALAALRKSEKYKATLKARDAAQARLDALNKQRPVEPAAIAKAGTALANEGIAIKKMETEAMERDDKVLGAKDAFDAAKKELDELDQEVESALANDPDYEQVQVQLEQAEVQLAQAKEQFAQMQKADAQARRAARPTGPTGSGGLRRGPPAGMRGSKRPDN